MSPDHDVTCTMNIPIADFTEKQARWNVPRSSEDTNTFIFLIIVASDLKTRKI